MRDRVRFLRCWKTHQSARPRRCKLVRQTKWKRGQRFDRPGCADIRSWKQERHRGHRSRAADTMPMDDQTQRRLASRESADVRSRTLRSRYAASSIWEMIKIVV